MTKTYQSLMAEATEAYENIKRITEAMDELATAVEEPAMDVKKPKRTFICDSSSKDYFTVGSPDSAGNIDMKAVSEDRSNAVWVILSKEGQRELIKTLQEGLNRGRAGQLSRKFYCVASPLNHRMEVSPPDSLRLISLRYFSKGKYSVWVILSEEDQRELIKTLQEGLNND